MTKKKAPIDPPFTLFYNGPFCQWYPSPMVIDQVQYSCAEQFMMARKAELFGDYEILEQIMETDDPAAQKALGKKVLGFDVDTWEAVARDIVMRGNFHKFMSSRRLYDCLMATKGTILVEASPTDRIWGIGLSEFDPKAYDSSNWEGRNWLGQVLTDLRDTIVFGKGPKS